MYVRVCVYVHVRCVANVCACMYVAMRMCIAYMCVYVRMCVYACTYVCAYMRACTYVRVCVCVCVYCICAYVRVCMCVCALRVCIYVVMDVIMYVCMYVCLYTVYPTSLFYIPLILIGGSLSSTASVQSILIYLMFVVMLWMNLSGGLLSFGGGWDSS